MKTSIYIMRDYTELNEINYLFSLLVKCWIHLFGVIDRSIGGLYMVSLKHVNRSFNNSVRLESKIGYLAGEYAKPTPASQIYSQLSIDCNSSALSWKNITRYNTFRVSYQDSDSWQRDSPDQISCSQLQ